MNTLSMKYLFISLIASILFLISCEENPENSDLTQSIVGSYSGTVTLKIGSNEANDIVNQQIIVEKIDDKRIRLIPSTYPDSSPVDSLEFEVDLTATPLGFIKSEGVMLTIASENFAEGSVSGTPFSLNSVQKEAHGKYDRNTSELIFAIEIIKNGVSDFEFFSGKKQ